MLNKELFEKFIKEWNIYSESVDKIDSVINGRYGNGSIYESDWNQAVEKMFDIFIDSHFTEKGGDLIYKYLYEPPLIISENTLFKENESLEIDNIDILWQYLVSNDYVK